MFDFIGLGSGTKLHFMNPDVSEIHINDIANALSKNCRFNGQINRFYSVAEHSVLLADYVYQNTGNNHDAFTMLLHDASEAYICDMPRPIKAVLPDYIELEEKITNCINKRFGISELTGHLKFLDENVVRVEAENLFDVVPDWVQYYVALDIELQCWDHETAQTKFLEAFNKYSEDL